MPLSQVRSTKPSYGMLERFAPQSPDNVDPLHPTRVVRLLDEDGRLALPLLYIGRPHLANHHGQYLLGLEKRFQPDKSVAWTFQTWFVLPFERGDYLEFPRRGDYLPPTPTLRKPKAPYDEGQTDKLDEFLALYDLFSF